MKFALRAAHTTDGPFVMKTFVAALGPYEVVGCDRIEADERPWLEVRLRRLAHA